MTGRVLDFLTSPEYLGGLFSTISVSILAYLMRSYVKRLRTWWRELRRDQAKVQAEDLSRVANKARGSDRVLLSLVLHEMRARLRAHTWLLLSFFILSMVGFIFFLFLEVESGLTIPTSMALGLLVLTMGAVVLFIFSLSDEGEAAKHSDVLAKVLDEVAETDGSPSESASQVGGEILVDVRCEDGEYAVRQDTVPCEERWSEQD